MLGLFKHNGMAHEQSAARHLSAAADDAAQAARDAADNAAYAMSQGVDRLREQAGTAMSTLSESARGGLDLMRERTADARWQLERAGAQAAGYVRDEPLKAVVIAAAVGAAVTVLASLLTSRMRRY